MTKKSKLSPVNAHVEEYLDYYCGLSNPPGFAVLLKGAWGSGKTWFIEQYQKNLEDRGIRALYISLYGMNNTADIEDKFFQLLDPIMSSRGMAVAGIIIKGLLKGALKIDLTGDGQDDGTWNIQVPNIDLRKKLDNIDKSILIFDDLERCDIEIRSLLGYINFFVEHNDMRVILIAHEDKLLENIDYPSIKEKLVGKTLEISPSFEDALTACIIKIKDVTLKDFLARKSSVIKNLYEIAGYNNLRSLNQICLEFSRIFYNLPEKVKNHSEALDDILKNLSAFSIEVQRGKLLTQDIDNLQIQYDNRLKNAINSKLTGASGQGSNIVEEEDSCHKIFEKFPFLGAYRIFPSYVWWKKLFHQGVIDLNELNESISSSKYFQDENRPSWMKLWHFSELSDDDFEKLIQEVESDFRSRIYSDSGVITHVVGLFLMFSSVGIYRRTPEDILEDAMSYVDELNHLSRLEPLSPYDVSLPAPIMFGSYQSLGVHGRETKEFKRFIYHLKETREKAYIEEMHRKAQELIKIMCDDISRFHKIICFDTPFDSDVDFDFDENRKYHNVPILSFIEASIFFDKIIAMKGEDARYIFWVLSERYKYDNNNTILIHELDWLRSFQEILLDEASRQKGKLSGYRLTLLNENYLVEAIERLSSAKASLQGKIVSQSDEIQIEI